jgi:hypothetical protein
MVKFFSEDGFQGIKEEKLRHPDYLLVVHLEGEKQTDLFVRWLTVLWMQLPCLMLPQLFRTSSQDCLLCLAIFGPRFSCPVVDSLKPAASFCVCRSC